MSAQTHHEHLVCQCHSPEHTLQFIYWDDDPTIYLLVHLNPVRFWRRLWIAIKYIFGYRSKYGCYEEVLLRPEDVGKLVNILDATQTEEPMLTAEEGLSKLRFACQGKQDDSACCAVAGLMAAGRKVDCLEDESGLTISVRTRQ